MLIRCRCLSLYRRYEGGAQDRFLADLFYVVAVLLFEKTGKDATPAFKVFITTLLNNAAAIQNVDIVDVWEDVQSMRDKHTSAVTERAVKEAIVEDSFADVCIKRTDRVVEQNNISR